MFGKAVHITLRDEWGGQAVMCSTSIVGGFWSRDLRAINMEYRTYILAIADIALWTGVMEQI